MHPRIKGDVARVGVGSCGGFDTTVERQFIGAIIEHEELTQFVFFRIGILKLHVLEIIFLYLHKSILLKIFKKTNLGFLCMCIVHQMYTFSSVKFY